MSPISKTLAVAILAITSVQATILGLGTVNGNCVATVADIGGDCDNQHNVTLAKGMTCKKFSKAMAEQGQTKVTFALPKPCRSIPMTVDFANFDGITNEHELCLNLGYGSSQFCIIKGLSGSCTAGAGADDC